MAPAKCKCALAAGALGAQPRGSEQAARPPGPLFAAARPARRPRRALAPPIEFGRPRFAQKCPGARRPLISWRRECQYPAGLNETFATSDRSGSIHSERPAIISHWAAQSGRLAQFPLRVSASGRQTSTTLKWGPARFEGGPTLRRRRDVAARLHEHDGGWAGWLGWRPAGWAGGRLAGWPANGQWARARHPTRRRLLSGSQNPLSVRSCPPGASRAPPTPGAQFTCPIGHLIDRWPARAQPAGRTQGLGARAPLVCRAAGRPKLTLGSRASATSGARVARPRPRAGRTIIFR